MKPELTITRPCPRCGGRGRVTQLTADTWEPVVAGCPTCEGQGVVRVAVSCSNCLFFDSQEDYCEQYGQIRHPDWGCKSWQEREATNGN